MGQALYRANLDDTGVVDEHVDAPEVRNGFRDQPAALVRIHQVAAEEIKVLGLEMLVLLEQADLRVFELVTVTGREHEPNVLAGKPGGERVAKPARAACNQHYRAF